MRPRLQERRRALEKKAPPTEAAAVRAFGPLWTNFGVARIGRTAARRAIDVGRVRLTLRECIDGDAYASQAQADAGSDPYVCVIRVPRSATQKHIALLESLERGAQNAEKAAN